MPNLDGISATRNIRQYDMLTPIISMTSNFTDNDIVQYVGSGMNDILPKPFSKRTLYGILEKYCAHLKVMQRFQDPTTIPRGLGLLPPATSTDTGSTSGSSSNSGSAVSSVTPTSGNLNENAAGSFIEEIPTVSVSTIPATSAPQPQPVGAVPQVPPQVPTQQVPSSHPMVNTAMSAASMAYPVAMDPSMGIQRNNMNPQTYHQQQHSSAMAATAIATQPPMIPNNSVPMNPVATPVWSQPPPSSSPTTTQPSMSMQPQTMMSSSDAKLVWAPTSSSETQAPQGGEFTVASNGIKRRRVNEAQ